MTFKILILTLLIIFNYLLLINAFYRDEEETEKETQKEDRNDFYIKLLNTTTEEILTFKNKKDFINSIEGYDTIKYFLKGTEEENNNKLIEWYYKGYKKL